MIRSFSGGFTVKSLRWSFMLLSGLSLWLFFASAGAPLVQSTQTLASFLGSGGANGGFNPLYQIGGPRRSSSPSSSNFKQRISAINISKILSGARHGAKSDIDRSGDVGHHPRPKHLEFSPGSTTH
jgi:hypothetical protein